MLGFEGIKLRQDAFLEDVLEVDVTGVTALENVLALAAVLMVSCHRSQGGQLNMKPQVSLQHHDMA